MRQIDWDSKLTDEDKAWARQASLPMVEQRIAENEERFGQESSAAKMGLNDQPAGTSALDPTGMVGRPNDGTQPPNAPPVGEGDDDTAYDDDYDQWKVAELKAEADGRDPKVEYASDARKQDVIDGLRAWDREHGDTES